MRKKTLNVPINELRTLRLQCGRDTCEGIIEIPLVRVVSADSDRHPDLRCPLCKNDFRDAGPPYDRLSKLAVAISEVTGTTAYRLDFVIPDNGT
jgi:hypothetical protein